MTTGLARRRVAIAALVPGALVLGAVAWAMPAQATESPAVEADVAALKAAVSKYQDPKAAVADGFAATDDCVSSPAGVMGYHYANQARLAGPPEVTKPPILVYQPAADGGRKLVAVEYFKPDADQNLATADDKPTLFGKQFDGPMEGHSPGMPKHYDLHVWAWQDNPSGMFAQFNPAGSCTVSTKGGSSGSSGSKVPVGGASTGDGSAAGMDSPWLVGFGAAAVAASGALAFSGRRLARRR